MRAGGDDRGDEPHEKGAPGTAADATQHITREGTHHERTRRFVRSHGGTPDGVTDASAPATVDHTRRFSRATRPWNGEGGTEPPSPPPRDTARWRRPPRRFRKRWIVWVILMTVITVPVGTWGWVWNTARQDERPSSDAIVVLGASQYNGQPSPVFEARLQHAADLHEDGIAPVIVTVGGNQPGDNYTEGGAGRDWLVKVGVPTEQVIAIGEGSDTLRSIEAVAHVFQEEEWESAVLVSDPWHSLRSRQIASDLGIDAETSPARSGPAVHERETQLWYITRETASLWYYWIFGDSSDIVVHAA